MLNVARPTAWVRAAALIALAAVMAVGWTASAPATAAVPQASGTVDTLVEFADVDGSVKFEREIAWLANEGISTGWRRGGVSEFRPYESITREAMAAFLYRMEGSPRYQAPARSPFVDVSTSSTNFTRQIGWLANERVSTGWNTSQGAQFRPKSAITRDAMAAFLYRLAGSPAVDLPARSPFADVTPSSSQFYKEIVWLSQQGISTGWRSGGRAEYRPLATITRDAMAAFLYRYGAQVDPEIAPVDGVVAAPEVTVVDESMAEQMIVGQRSIAFSEGATSLPQPNDVLVAGVTDATPSGLLVRVESVSRSSDGSAVVITSPATLRDAILTTDGAIDVQGDLVAASGESLDPDTTVTSGVDGGVGMARSTATEPVTVLTHIVRSQFKFGRNHERLAGTAAEGDVAFALTMETRAKVDAQMRLDFGFLSINEVEVEVSPSLESEVSLSSSVAVSGDAFSKEISLAKLRQHFTFPVGPIPVVVVANEELSLNGKVTGAATLETSTTLGVSNSNGFRYVDGAFELIDPRPTLSASALDVAVSGSITPRLSLDFDAEVTLYDVAGLTFGFGPYVEVPVSVTLGSPPTWSCPAAFGVQGRVGTIAGIRAFGFTLKEWRAEVSRDWEIRTFNPCAGTIPTLKPGPDPEPDPDPGTDPDPTPDPEPEPEELSITRSSLSDAVVDQPYAATLRARGGEEPYSWTVEGLPAGVAVTEAGNILGTPTEVGESTLSVTVTDGAGATVTREVTLAVVPDGIPRAPEPEVTLISDGLGVTPSGYGSVFVSDDGRYVFFSIEPTSTMDGLAGYRGPVRLDRDTGEIVAVAVSNTGAHVQQDEPQKVNTYVAAISPDGEFAAFVTNLDIDGLDVPAGQEGIVNVVVRDIERGTTTVVPVPEVSGYPEHRNDPYRTLRFNGSGEYLVFDWQYYTSVLDTSEPVAEWPALHSDIYRYSTTTGESERLTNAEDGAYAQPALSADGTRLAYTWSDSSYWNRTERGVYVRDLTTGAEDVIVAPWEHPDDMFSGRNFWVSTDPQITHDGSRVVFLAGGEIHPAGPPGYYVFDLDSGRTAPIVPDQWREYFSRIYEPHLAGDGGQFSFRAYGPDEASAGGDDYEMYGVDLEDGGIRILGGRTGTVSHNGRFVGSVPWSSDGTVNVYVTEWQ